MSMSVRLQSIKGKRLKGMVYRLDLSTLLLMLRKSTGKLSSEIQHVPGVKGRCQVFLGLEEGSITTCLIKDKRGKEIASGAAAVRFIQHQVLEWHYTEDQIPSPASQEIPPPQMPQVTSQMPQVAPNRQMIVPSAQLPVPRRIRPVAQGEFLSWPRLYRVVYSLIDGRTSVHHIIMLLTREQSAEKVLEVLADLQWRGLIVIDRNSPADYFT